MSGNYHNCVNTSTHFEILLKYEAKIIKPVLLFLTEWAQ